VTKAFQQATLLKLKIKVLHANMKLSLIIVCIIFCYQNRGVFDHFGGSLIEVKARGTLTFYF